MSNMKKSSFAGEKYFSKNRTWTCFHRVSQKSLFDNKMKRWRNADCDSLSS